MHRIKSATLEIANLAILILCIKFEKFCGQTPTFEMLWVCQLQNVSIMGLSLYQIQKLCHCWSKKVIFSKRHPYSISILVPYCSHTILASFKIKTWNLDNCARVGWWDNLLDQNLDNHAFIGLVSVIMMILRAHKAPNPAPILWGR